MVARTETQLVTLTIDGKEVTVPAGTYILQAAEAAGIEVPNLCYQPLLRPWGSCRICTVEIAGPRGGLIESCATPVRDGMEVLTHSPEVVEARQFILQMYLIDHALDCPTCDKSGECYLQDNTYLHNIDQNPYRRPKLAQTYKHFSDFIDYKWDRCIVCARCTRVCDEMIGVTAITVAGRSLEAEITPAYGIDLSETTCTNCGMCIAVCPVGALTDRHFAHHPWELDTVETTCGLCDVGCTLNIEHTRGIVRRTTHLWERGVNLGYTCELGRWGHEHVQDPTRLRYAQIREADGYLEVELDEALDLVAERLRHYQGSQFAALGSPDNTNEDSYVLQQFTRAVMGSNNIDRLINPRLGAIEQASLASFGTLANTAGMQEAMTSSNAVLVVGPDPGTVSPVASYWLYWAHRYRETTFIVLHDQEYFLAGRSNNWINVAPEHQADVVKAIGKLIVNEGLAKADPASWFELERIDPAEVASRAGVPLDTLTKAAMLYATGGKGVREGTSEYAASAIWHSLVDEERVDVQPIALALHNLALLCGNVGRPGGGVLALRMLTNYQGSTDVGCHPAFLTGTRAVSDPEVRGQAEQLWSSRWNEGAVAQNGFKQLRSLPAEVGVGHDGLIEAIERGQIKAMYIAAQSHEFGEVNKRYMHYGRMRFDRTISPELLAALAKLEFLAVEDCFESDLTRIAHVVLPTAMFLEKDGSFTNFDRTVQRVRFAVSPPGDAKPSREHIGAIAERLGYSIPADDPDRILSEIASLTPEYAGISFPRLERGGMQWPVRRFGTEQTVFLSVGNGLVPDEIRFVAD